MTDAEEPAEEPSEEPREADPDRLVRLMTWLAENPMTVAAYGVLGTVVASTLLGLGLPRWLRIIGLTGAGTALLAGRAVASRVEAYLPDPPQVWVVDVDARDPYDSAIYRIPTDRFEEFDVTEGQVTRVNPHLLFAREVDQESQELVGTWPGTLDDRELMQHQRKVAECREVLEDQAKAGAEIDLQAFTIVRTATLQAVRRVVRTFESGTLPDDGDGLTDVVDATLEDFDLDRDSYLADPDDASSDLSTVLDGVSMADLDGDDDHRLRMNGDDPTAEPDSQEVSASDD